MGVSVLAPTVANRPTATVGSCKKPPLNAAIVLTCKQSIAEIVSMNCYSKSLESRWRSSWCSNSHSAAVQASRIWHGLVSNRNSTILTKMQSILQLSRGGVMENSGKRLSAGPVSHWLSVYDECPVSARSTHIAFYKCSATMLTKLCKIPRRRLMQIDKTKLSRGCFLTINGFTAASCRRALHSSLHVRCKKNYSLELKMCELTCKYDKAWQAQARVPIVESIAYNVPRSSKLA